MNLSQILNKATNILQEGGSASPRLDCLILLEDMTKKDRSWLLAHPEFELTDEQVEVLNKQIERRADHEPLAYIRGKSEFYGREFIVSADTLQPRPETETMIELLLDHIKSGKLKARRIIDVGTGSGCLAITAKLELPDIEVYATDISKNCLKIARQNAQLLKANVRFSQGDLLEPLTSIHDQSPTIILANLPYVPDDFTINQAAMHEPEIAIFGGPDGLESYRKIFGQLSGFNLHTVAVLTESLPPQHRQLEDAALNHGFRLLTSQDLIQVFKPTT